MTGPHWKPRTDELRANNAALSPALKREDDVRTRFVHAVEDHHWAKNDGTTVHSAAHEMTVVLNQGVHRHLRFRKPGTSSYWFDILTSPGVLTINGDMGSFTFSRLNDMFEFFHGPGINPQYWHEKLTNDGGSMEFSEDLFRQYVVEHFLDTVDDWADHHSDDPMEGRNPAELWWGIQAEVLDEAGDETSAHTALETFEHDGYRFHDTWEWNLRDHSFRYLWCCWAIVWAIEQFHALPPDTTAALTAVRSGSDQTVELRAKVVLLETELADMRARFEASQLLADQAIKERDEWHRLAVESDRTCGAMGAEHMRNRGALIRENEELRNQLAARNG